MNESIALRLGGQSNLSERICVSFKRHAAKNGGLRKLAQELKEDYNNLWYWLNRASEPPIKLIAKSARIGIDEPLRILAESSNHEITPKLKFLRTTHPPKPVRSYGLDMHHATAMITRVLEEALADQRIDDKELEKLKARLHDARKTLAAFEAKITGLIA
jgi:hypothetical protein